MKRIGSRVQRTIRQSVTVSGLGLITSREVQARFHPAPVQTGLIFRRVDLPGQPHIPAHADQVVSTDRRTTLGQAPAQITLVEHVLAALSGLQIDNCLIDLNGPEPPGLDGSAQGFVDALLHAEIQPQDAERSIWTPSEPICLRAGGARIELHPAEGVELTMSYLLDYGPFSPIVPQIHTLTLTPERFRAQLAGCRTFLLAEEAVQLRAAGIGQHLTTRELLVFGEQGPLDNSLRFADEPARHKILDMVGDLSLTGLNLAGHVVAYRSGHPLNVALAKELCRRRHAQRDPLSSWAA